VARKALIEDEDEDVRAARRRPSQAAGQRQADAPDGQERSGLPLDPRVRLVETHLQVGGFFEELLDLGPGPG
jgi:hypothetical protein